MAGPVFYSDLYPESTRLPEYYDGKLFIYEWIRGWIKVVTMKPNGDFEKMEPFMESTKFNSLIDLEMGSNGKLYLLEYGSGWFSKNANATLSRIDYNPGNRAPKVEDISLNQTSGMVPFSLEITANASDPENDALTYVWDLGNGETKETSEPNLQYTYDEIGEYSVSVEVRDPSNLNASSNAIDVYVGNVAPEVNISIEGNKTFYFPNKKVEYSIEITDENHPDAGEDLSTLIVSADYIEGFDKAEASLGHLIMTEAMVGKSLVESLTCKSCHKQDEVSIGPAYTAVAAKYEKDPQADSYLINKIIKGGSGVWGETMMPANPDMKQNNARKIVSWILSLAGDKEANNSLPASGSIDPTVGKPASANGVFILSASFMDKGGDNIKPLAGSNSLALQNSQLDFNQVANLQGFNSLNMDGRNIMVAPTRPGHFSFNQIDLTDVTSVEIISGSQEVLKQGYKLVLKLDGPEGKTIGETTIQAKNGARQGAFISIPTSVQIDPVADGKLHDLYIVTEPIGEDEINMALVSMELKAE